MGGGERFGYIVWLVGRSKQPPLIYYISSLLSSCTQLYINSAFESCSVIPPIA